MTLQTVLSDANARLHAFDQAEARLVAWWCIESVLDIPRSTLVLAGDVQVGRSDAQAIESLVARCAAGEPVQYVCGFTEFFGHKIEVTPDVLIPRPETEGLVEGIIRYARANDRELKVLDVGTGSGCISVALARELEGVSVWAVDNSRSAINIARKNCAGLAVVLEEVNILDEEQWEKLWDTSFDVIVSNPPYVPIEEFDAVPSIVKNHEPGAALFVEDSMVFYRALERLGRCKLVSGGLMILEIHELKGGSVQNVFNTRFYTGSTVGQDLGGRDRFFTAVRTQVKFA